MGWYAAVVCELIDLLSVVGEDFLNKAKDNDPAAFKMMTIGMKIEFTGDNIEVQNIYRTYNNSFIQHRINPEGTTISTTIPGLCSNSRHTS